MTVTHQVPRRLIRRCEKRDETTVHSATAVFMNPAIETEAPRSRYISGQAVPSTESGSPSEINDR